MFERSRRGVRIAFFAAASALTASVASPARAADAIAVQVDQASLIKLPERVSTVVVGNPLIADVSMQAGGTMVVTGKGYGSTNVLALDKSGSVVLDRTVNVESAGDNIVTVYRGVDRESYICSPSCQRRITLGDGPTYFQTTLNQSSVLNGQAAAAAVASGIGNTR